jgi:hypothetical protein
LVVDKKYSAQEVKDMLATQRGENDQMMNGRMAQRMESKLAEMLDKRLPVGVVVVTSPTKPPLSMDFGIPLGGTPRGTTKDGSSSYLNSTPYTYPPAYVPMPHVNILGNSPKLNEVNFSFWKSSMRSNLPQFLRGAMGSGGEWI